MIVHLNGMPGIGKLTVGRLLAEKLDARLIDNHLLIDLVMAVCERGSPNYALMIKKLMAVVFEQIAETPAKGFVLTNALAAESETDRERFEQISSFCACNNRPFIQILLTCELAENKRRLVSENRKIKGKLINPEDLENLHKNYTLYHPPTTYSLTIDTTGLPAEAVSDQIRIYIERVTPNR